MRSYGQRLRSPQRSPAEARNTSNDPTEFWTPSYRSWIEYYAMVVSNAAYNDMNEGPNVYFYTGGSDSESFLIHYVNQTAFIGFGGTNIKNSEHCHQAQDIDLAGIRDGSRKKGMSGYLEVMKTISLDLKTVEAKGITHVVFCGHSRGGILAMLKLAEYFLNPSTNLNSVIVYEAIAYGTPYCFNRDASNYFLDMKLSKYFTTLANTGDVVPTLFWAIGHANDSDFDALLNELGWLKIKAAHFFGMFWLDVTNIQRMRGTLSQYFPVGSYKVLGDNDSMSPNAYVSWMVAKWRTCNRDPSLFFQAHMSENYLNFVKEAFSGVENTGMPLMTAAQNDDMQTLMLLLPQFAANNFKRRDRTGKTPLMVAAQFGRMAAAEYLLKYEVYLKLLETNKSIQFEKVDINVEKKSVFDVLRISDYYGQTPLMFAICNRQTKLVKYFLARGADVNSDNNYGETPLIMAAKIGEEACVRMLLEHGADVNAESHVGLSAVHAAVKKGHMKVADILIENNASVKDVTLQMIRLAIS